MADKLNCTSLLFEIERFFLLTFLQSLSTWITKQRFLVSNTSPLTEKSITLEDSQTLSKHAVFDKVIFYLDGVRILKDVFLSVKVRIDSEKNKHSSTTNRLRFLIQYLLHYNIYRHILRTAKNKIWTNRSFWAIIILRPRRNPSKSRRQIYYNILLLILC